MVGRAELSCVGIRVLVPPVGFLRGRAEAHESLEGRLEAGTWAWGGVGDSAVRTARFDLTGP